MLTGWYKPHQISAKGKSRVSKNHGLPKVKCASRVRAIALGTDNTIYVGCENGMVYQSEIDGSNLKYFASGKGRVQSISCS